MGVCNAMIIGHDAKGEIVHIVFDPVPTGLAALMQANGETVVEIPPEPVYDGTFDEAGNPGISEYISAEASHDTHYVLDGAIAARPAIDLPSEITAEVGDEIELVGLPGSPADPCLVHIDGATHQVGDGELFLDADMPAEYSILIEKFPYQRKTIKVTINGTA